MIIDLDQCTQHFPISGLDVIIFGFKNSFAPFTINSANKLIEKILTNGVKRKINTNPNQLSFDF